MRVRNHAGKPLWIIAVVTTVMVGLARALLQADEPEDYAPSGEERPLNCSLFQHVSTFRTYYVPQVGGGPSIPFRPTDLQLFEFNTADPSNAWYKPNIFETVDNGITYEWINSGVHIACRVYSVPGIGDVAVFWYLGLTGQAVVTSLRSPRPRFAMSTASQQSGDGGSLTISAGHSVSLQATTSDYGSPPASLGDHVWMLDQAQIGTGSGTSIVPEYGNHTIWVSLSNSAGQGEASASVNVVPPDEAGSCDDPMTDVVETNCSGPTDHGTYGIGGSSCSGTRFCWVLDWYDWTEATQRYEYWYTEELYCWYEE